MISPPLVQNSDARRLFLAAQGLSRPSGQRLTRGGLLDLIEHLGFVQVDSINTVERAHHLILFSRNRNYRHAQLAHLLERKATLFENWTHDASIIPTHFYPYWMRRFAREREGLRARWRKWHREDFEEQLDDVLARVRADGPVMARHLGDGQKNGTGWWDWHPSKTALEYLWRTGELAIARREGFQKVYDLAERVIPEPYRTTAPSTEDLIDWACWCALDRLSFATPGELAAFWGGITPAEAAKWCRKNLGKGIVEILIEPAGQTKPKLAYTHRNFRELLSNARVPSGQIRVLSPFDPVIRDRDRAQRLFNFRYRIEVFVPEAERQYGYYVFPLLERDRFIGRINMKHHRQSGLLSVNGLWLEPRLQFTRRRQEKLAAELDRLRRFICADQVVFENGFLRSEN